MRIVLNVIGILLVPVGAVWMLQGFNVIRQGFMAGHRRWILIGAVLLVAAAVILVLNNRRKKPA